MVHIPIISALQRQEDQDKEASPGCKTPSFKTKQKLLTQRQTRQWWHILLTPVLRRPKQVNMSSRTVWYRERIPGQLGIHRQTLSQNTQKRQLLNKLCYIYFTSIFNFFHN